MIPLPRAWLLTSALLLGCVAGQIAAVIAKHGMKSAGLPFRTTAENLARHFFGELLGRVNVVSVKVYETPETCAEFRRE